MPISDRDNINHRDLAVILGHALTALLRGGHLSQWQKNAIERRIDRADIREAEKQEIRQAARAKKQTGFSWF